MHALKHKYKNYFEMKYVVSGYLLMDLIHPKDNRNKKRKPDRIDKGGRNELIKPSSFMILHTSNKSKPILKTGFAVFLSLLALVLGN